MSAQISKVRYAKSITDCFITGRAMKMPDYNDHEIRKQLASFARTERMIWACSNNVHYVREISTGQFHSNLRCYVCHGRGKDLERAGHEVIEIRKGGI